MPVNTGGVTDVVDRLENAGHLDPVINAVRRVVNGTLRSQKVRDALHGVWLGHPLHPPLTDIPIGAWTSSVILDWTGGEDCRSASDRLILTGVLAAGATAATGWSDWPDAEQGSAAVRRSGLVHAAANGTAAALMISSYLARKRGARGLGRLLSLAGSAALGTGGWLGGHLGYTLGAGVAS